MEETLYIVVMIPAWNEAGSIGEAVSSIYEQTRLPERIFVVPNNTTDLTSVEAMAAGAEVLVMPGKNEKKKAGALNWALEKLSPTLDAQRSAVLVMDADTMIEPDFIEKAEKKMIEEARVGGVSSIFVGRNSTNLLGILQQMEFARFARLVHKRAEVYVLSGTASLISWDVLKEIKGARLEGKLLPEGESYYDVDSMTEDNELTLAILVLGFSVPHVGVKSITDVMEDYNSLYHQRKRWYIGALQNIKEYGRKMPPWMRMIYWVQQIGLYMALAITPIVLFAFTIYLIQVVLSEGAVLGWSRITSIVLLILYLFVQVTTVWDQGWKCRLVALSYFPEIVYAIFLLIFYAAALWSFLTGKDMKWKHT